TFTLMSINNLEEIRWGNFDEATRITSISRGQLYNLIHDGLIRSRVIRRKNARGSGLRLIDLNSLQEFIENSPSESPAEVRERNRGGAGAMIKARHAQSRKLGVDVRTAAAARRRAAAAQKEAA